MSISATPRRAGSPVLFLAAIVVSWGAARAITWEPLIDNAFDTRPRGAAAPSLAREDVGRALAGALYEGTVTPFATAIAQVRGAAMPSAAHRSSRSAKGSPLRFRLRRPVARSEAMPNRLGTSPYSQAMRERRLPAPGLQRDPAQLAAPDSADRRAAPAVQPVFSGSPAGRIAGVNRWTGDAWTLVRGNSGGRALAAGASGYGGSQAGGVLRYAVIPGSEHRPAAHARMSSALGGFREREVALGLSARPIAGAPLRIYAEARAQSTSNQTRWHPAVFVVTEIAPQKLGRGMEAEIYGQAGYVGGRDATPFFDAQATVDRSLAKSSDADFRLGGGAWAGGQEGAQRLDVGPHASIRLPIAGVNSRIALDYRLRVAGDAEPGSGPTLTLSTGF